MPAALAPHVALSEMLTDLRHMIADPAGSDRQFALNPMASYARTERQVLALTYPQAVPAFQALASPLPAAERAAFSFYVFALAATFEDTHAHSLKPIRDEALAESRQALDQMSPKQALAFLEREVRDGALGEAVYFSDPLRESVVSRLDAIRPQLGKAKDRQRVDRIGAYIHDNVMACSATRTGSSFFP